MLSVLRVIFDFYFALSLPLQNLFLTRGRRRFLFISELFISIRVSRKKAQFKVPDYLNENAKPKIFY